MFWIAAALAAASWQAPDPELARRIDALIPAASSESPGCAVAVLDRGAVVYQRAWGLADVELRAPLTNDSVFLAGSIAKQFTAAAVLLLAQEKKLTLDDDVRKYIPELPRYSSTITIRELLAHTSGLKDDMELLKVSGFHTWEDAIGERDVLSIVTAQRSTNFTPGTEYLYSDTGYDLLAIVVRRASGMSLPAFASERIFKPLGMEHTEFRDDHRRLIPGRVTGYVSDGGTLETAVPQSSQVGAANLFTTTGDLLRWAENFSAPRAGGAGLVAALLEENHLADGSPIGYGGGLELKTYRGHRAVEHDGAQAGYVGDFLLFPDDGLAIAQLCNLRQNPRKLPRKIADLFLGTSSAPQPSRPPAQPVTEDDARIVGGIFWSDRDGFYNKIVVRDGRVTCTDADGDTYELVKVGPRLFALREGPDDVRFAFTAAGVERRIGNASNFFRRVAPPTGSTDYSGQYVNRDVSVSWEITVRGGQLFLRRPRWDEEALKPVFADGFESSQWILHFTRTKDGRIDGIDVLNQRLRSTRFERAAPH